MRHCSKCGAEVSDDANFCEHCGADLAGDSKHNSPLIHRVQLLIGEGQKIEAIRVYREATGVGLAEAKAAVEAIERGGRVVDDARGSGSSGRDLGEQLLRLMREGRKIEAIKLHRERTGLGLKESKDFVEALAAKAGIPASRGGCAGVVLVLFIALGVASACAARAFGEDDAPPATFSTAESADEGWLVHRVESECQSGPTDIRVLLPDKLDATQRYSVLYVLPVEANRESRYGDGLAEVKRYGLHNKHGLICVAPTFASLPWYADHPTDKTIRQETYFVKDVVPFIERTYPVRAEKEARWLLGFSKSGWGAWSLLARHPDLFGRAAAWDAPLDMQHFNLYGAGPIFGTQDHFESYRVLPALKSCQPLASSSPRLVLTGYDNFREHHVTAHKLLDEWKVPHIYRDGPKRKHVWDSGWVEEAVALLTRLDEPSK